MIEKMKILIHTDIKKKLIKILILKELEKKKDHQL